MLRPCLRSGSGGVCSFRVRTVYWWFLFAVGGILPCGETGSRCSFYFYSKPTCQEWPVWWKLSSFPCRRYLLLKKKLFLVSFTSYLVYHLLHLLSDKTWKFICLAPYWLSSVDVSSWLRSPFVHEEHQNAVPASPSLQRNGIIPGGATTTNLLGNAKIILEL